MLQKQHKGVLTLSYIFKPSFWSLFLMFPMSFRLCRVPMSVLSFRTWRLWMSVLSSRTWRLWMSAMSSRMRRVPMFVVFMFQLHFLRNCRWQHNIRARTHPNNYLYHAIYSCLSVYLAIYVAKAIDLTFLNRNMIYCVFWQKMPQCK